MKRGEIYLAEIKEYHAEGLMVKVGDVEILLPAGEIKDGIKQKHKKMIGWFIPVRIKSIRPFAISNMRIDKTKLRALGLRDVKPIEKTSGTTTPPSTQVGQVKEKDQRADKEESQIDAPEIKKMELTCKPLMNGIMAYWTKVEDAVAYNITLYINEQAISKRIHERTEMYCTFTGLAAIDGITSRAAASPANVIGGDYSRPQHSGKDYYIKVEAENRTGDIIETSDKVKCAVREF